MSDFTPHPDSIIGSMQAKTESITTDSPTIEKIMAAEVHTPEFREGLIEGASAVTGTVEAIVTTDLRDVAADMRAKAEAVTQKSSTADKLMNAEIHTAEFRQGLREGAEQIGGGVKDFFTKPVIEFEGKNEVVKTDGKLPGFEERADRVKGKFTAAHEERESAKLQAAGAGRDI